MIFLHINGARSIFYYLMITNTLNMIDKKENYRRLTNIQPEKYQSLYETVIPVIYTMGGEDCGDSSYSWR